MLTGLQITYDPNMQIIACIAQDASGDYYAGTGEGFYNGFYQVTVRWDFLKRDFKIN
ncbi:MAG: hypothetical protein IPL35_17660 [Sphingobacteriales bacterium]|nr:hypothetical protein [Sphingobacteriales bacterium]